MKKLFIVLVFLIYGMDLYAEDIYKSTISHVNINQIIFGDGTVQVSSPSVSSDDLITETNSRIAGDNTLGVSTGTIHQDLQTSKNNILNSTTTLKTDLNTEISDRQTGDNAIGVTTATLRTDLTSEVSDRQTGDNDLGYSTGVISGIVTQLQVDTTTINNKFVNYAELKSTQTFTGSNTFNNYTTITSTLNVNSGKLFVGSNGKVGIGTTAPDHPLTVKASVNTGIVLKNAALTYDLISFKPRGSGAGDVDGGYITISDAGTTKIAFNTAGNSYFNSGNLGIGTNAPDQYLVVAGTIAPSVNLIGDLGTAAKSWASIHYQTLVAHSLKDIDNKEAINTIKNIVIEDKSTHGRAYIPEKKYYKTEQRFIPTIDPEQQTYDVEVEVIEHAGTNMNILESMYIKTIQDLLKRIEILEGKIK